MSEHVASHKNAALPLHGLPAPCSVRPGPNGGPSLLHRLYLSTADVASHSLSHSQSHSLARPEVDLGTSGRPGAGATCIASHHCFHLLSSAFTARFFCRCTALGIESHQCLCHSCHIAALAAMAPAVENDLMRPTVFNSCHVEREFGSILSALQKGLCLRARYTAVAHSN